MTPSGSLTGKSLGRYNIGPLLGRGGMGEVYRAEDVALHRPVALKVLPRELAGDPDRLARFSHEARAASALNHPHLLAIYEVGQARIDSETVHFLAMELVDGDTLRQVLSSRRTPLKRTLDYLAQVAEALAAAHAAGIIHRDLKPENVMIAAAGYAKVLDFGLAKLAPQRASVGDPAATIPTVTSPASTPGLVMGTVGYMSPEQAQGLPIDQRSDIFSFGCVLYEAAAGVRPFSGASTIDTLHKIVHQQPEPLAALVPTSPPELHRIVRKCLAKSPDDRYQSMKEVAIDLRDLRRELESGARGDRRPRSGGSILVAAVWSGGGYGGHHPDRAVAVVAEPGRSGGTNVSGCRGAPDPERPGDRCADLAGWQLPRVCRNRCRDAFVVVLGN